MIDQHATSVSRFEPVEQPSGWTVVDLLAETVIVHRRSWDRAAAAVVAEALNAAPAYAVHWAWFTPPAYTIHRWGLLAKPLAAVSLDGRTKTTLAAGTAFDAYSDADDLGRVRIAAFSPADDAVHLWLVQQKELAAAAAQMRGGREAVR